MNTGKQTPALCSHSLCVFGCFRMLKADRRGCVASTRRKGGEKKKNISWYSAHTRPSWRGERTECPPCTLILQTHEASIEPQSVISLVHTFTATHDTKKKKKCLLHDDTKATKQGRGTGSNMDHSIHSERSRAGGRRKSSGASEQVGTGSALLADSHAESFRNNGGLSRLSASPLKATLLAAAMSKRPVAVTQASVCISAGGRST